MRTAILLAALWATAAAAQDEVQTWIDESGEVHYTNDPSQVPAQYRRTMKRTAGDGALSVIPSSAKEGGAKGSSGSTESTGSTGRGASGNFSVQMRPEPKLDEAYWRQRFRDVRRRISELEDALREQKTIESQIGPTRAQASDGSLGDPRLEQVKRRMAEITRDLDSANSELRSLNQAAAEANVPQSWR